VIAIVGTLAAVAGSPLPANDTAVFPTAIVWSTEIPSEPSAPPLVVGDRVVLGLQSGQVLARDVTDGASAWTADLLAVGELAGENGLVLVPVDGAIHALSLDSGQPRWKVEAGRITAPLLLRGGWVIVATGEQLTALRAADGVQVWTRKVAFIEHRPAIDGDVIYASVADGRVITVDLPSGSLRWEREVGANPTEPFVYGDRVYLGAGGRDFVCLKTETGSEEWRFRIGAAVTGTADADASRVYAVSMDNLLRAFRRSNGAILWKQDVGYRPAAGPIVVGSTVAVPGRTATIRTFDTTTRKVVAQLALPDPAVMAPGMARESAEARVVMAIVTGDPGKPWLLSLTGQPLPALPAPTPLTELPGMLLPAMKPPGL
jgi:outer membrane protein assembly factor BamB